MAKVESFPRCVIPYRVPIGVFAKLRHAGAGARSAIKFRDGPAINLPRALKRISFSAVYRHEWNSCPSRSLEGVGVMGEDASGVRARLAANLILQQARLFRGWLGQYDDLGFGF